MKKKKKGAMHCGKKKMCTHTHTFAVSRGEMLEIRELYECSEENGMVTGTQLERKRRKEITRF